ncbi:MAG: hypothetical protein U0V70_17890 [Terriglobia bacterium]
MTASDDAHGVQMVEDVVALLDQVGISKAHVVGYSMGGMGWMPEGSKVQKVWELMPTRQRSSKPAACIRGLSNLAVSEEELKAIHVPVLVIVGDRDPVKGIYVEPLERARKDWKVIEVKGAGHLNGVAKTEFKESLKKWLDSQAKPLPQ